jgi:hypothetical protein
LLPSSIEPTKVQHIIAASKSFAHAAVNMLRLLSFNQGTRIHVARVFGLKRSGRVIRNNPMRVLIKATLIVPIAVVGFLMIQNKPLPDPGFKCSNGGLVVIAVENQKTRAIAEKYCTGDIEKADQALIKRYRGTIIPHWAFINVESLGTR